MGDRHASPRTKENIPGRREVTTDDGDRAAVQPHHGSDRLEVKAESASLLLHVVVVRSLKAVAALDRAGGADVFSGVRRRGDRKESKEGGGDDGELGEHLERRLSSM